MFGVRETIDQTYRDYVDVLGEQIIDSLLNIRLVERYFDVATGIDTLGHLHPQISFD